MNSKGIKKQNFLIFVPLLLFLALSACSSLDSNSDYRDRISIIVGQITIPDSVQLGSNISILFTTAGFNSCWLKGRDVVKKNENVYHITPYDQEYTGPDPCLDVMVNFTHIVILRPITEGVQKVEIQARFWGQDSVGTILRETIVY